MRKVMKWRYYCEYCKKSGASSGHMKKHELHCTMNPVRECGMCKAIGNETRPMALLLIAFGVGDKQGMDDLRDTCEDCPACTLATIRQSGVMKTDYDEDSNSLSQAWQAFSFKDAKKEFWIDVADLRGGGMGDY